MKITYLAAIALTAHAMPHFGACPDVPGVENFSMADFAAPSEGHDAAKWYERERDPWFMFEMGQECGTQEYFYDADADELHFYFRYTMLGMGMGIPGKMKCDTEGKCKLQMWINGEYTEESDNAVFQIIAYESGKYAVMWSCMEMMGEWGGFTWLNVLQRENPMDLDQVEDAYETIKGKVPTYVPLGWPMTHMDTQGDSCSYDWGRFKDQYE